MHMLAHLSSQSEEHLSCHSGGKILGTNMADLVKDVANNNGCHFLDIHDILGTMLSTLYALPHLIHTTDLPCEVSVITPNLQMSKLRLSNLPKVRELIHGRVSSNTTIIESRELN